MFDVLRAHILKRIDLSDEEFTDCTTFFIPRKIKKGQFLLQEGDVCKHCAFVNNGCLRCYTIDDNGTEHVVDFAIEDWWIADLYSFLTGEPAVYNIDALENSEVLLLDRVSLENLCSISPNFERFFRLLHENNYIATHRRIVNFLSASAEERYLSFLETYPEFLQRLPQRQIASYLGITPESLSRLRKRLAENE
ncbi:Crp/Fnr family transcriptional regulator [candidate division KSB1 bacterium]|nr:Crp/Fnr family transcriptional regulator [candidate division KSB1 bacterium]